MVPAALRLIEPRDAEWVARAAYEWPSTHRWSLRGSSPKPEVIALLLWKGVATQQAIVDDDGRPLALLQVYDLDLHSGYAYVSALVHPSRGEDPVAIRSLAAQFIATTVNDFPLRLLYVDVTADQAADTVTWLFPQAQCEAVLSSHERRSVGVYVDLQIYTIRTPETR